MEIHRYLDWLFLDSFHFWPSYRIWWYPIMSSTRFPLLSSGRCEASQLVVQASARCETSHGRLLCSGTCPSRVTKAACRCSMLGNAKGEPLGLNGDLCRKRSRTSPRVARLHTVVRLRWGRVVSEFLRARASAGHRRTRGDELHRASKSSLPNWESGPAGRSGP